MLQKFTSFLLLCFVLVSAKAQTTYNSASFIKAGDTVYLTRAYDSLNYGLTGPNFLWDYSALNGVSQSIYPFKLPTQEGFSSSQWSYIYNTSNVNIASSGGPTIQVSSGVTRTNPIDFYLKSSTSFQEKATSFDIVAPSYGLNTNLKNTYTSPDLLYSFPIKYNNVDSSDAAYTTTIPFLLYSHMNQHRVNQVNGWGTLITPYGTFNKCLKLESRVVRTDTISLAGSGVPAVTTNYRELKWFDSSYKYPVLYVIQDLYNGKYRTQYVEYYDVKRTFPPKAKFVYTPAAPDVLDTVFFQNFSTNATSYAWVFGDPASGANNVSTQTAPYHIYSSAGIYSVLLIASNGTQYDTFRLSVRIGTNYPHAAFNYNPVTLYIGDTVNFQNQSSNASTYYWNFKDPASGKDSVSILAQPTHVFYNAGNYYVTLIAYGVSTPDTFTLLVHVIGYLPVELKSFTGKAIKNIGQLSWETSNEINLASFIIEKSSNGKDFNTIGRIKPTGENQGVNKYEFSDYSLSENINYYRLKMIDNSGKESYSSIVIIKRNNTNISIISLNNPIKKGQECKISIDAKVSQKLNLTLVNQLGIKVYQSEEYNAKEGTNIYSIPTNQFPSGIYFLKCTNPHSSNEAITVGLLLNN